MHRRIKRRDTACRVRSRGGLKDRPLHKMTIHRSVINGPQSIGNTQIIKTYIAYRMWWLTQIRALDLEENKEGLTATRDKPLNTGFFTNRQD